MKSVARFKGLPQSRLWGDARHVMRDKLIEKHLQHRNALNYRMLRDAIRARLDDREIEEGYTAQG